MRHCHTALRFALIAVALAIGPLAIAQETPAPEQRLAAGPRLDRGVFARHYILTAEHVLLDDERADLQARGCVIIHALPNNRYLVSVDDPQEIPVDFAVRSLEPITPEQKLHHSAFSALAAGRTYARLTVQFHDDVTLDQARAAIESVGGELETPMTLDFDFPQLLRARVPAGAVRALAQNDAVLGVSGRVLKPAGDNAIAAALSNVTPLFSAPYNLTGNGVVLTLYEAENGGAGRTDASHPQFGGRVTTHTTSANSDHATHVAGTILASGVDASSPNAPRAKGMAPSATLHEFDINDADFLRSKAANFPALGITADNNSWGFILGWCPSFNCPSSSGWVWTENNEFFGGYEVTETGIDKLARSTNVLMVHSAGNDASTTGPDSTPFAHQHVDVNGDTIKNETFCYSADGSGNDCPASCTPGISNLTTNPTPHCETVRHPANGPWRSIGLTASAKNNISVGAIDSGENIGSFSSRGPTQDGRVKPEVVTKGVGTFSTLPNDNYGTLSGTSMAAPVVTGIAAILTEQWHKTFAGATPDFEALKTLIIAGADDITQSLGVPGCGAVGPDYCFGFGLVNAKASADLIIADNNTGSRIKSGTISQAGKVEIPMTLASTQNIRVVLGWADPEVPLTGDAVADKTLINDLDLSVVDTASNTVLPYVLDFTQPTKAATHGVNTTDNVEEVEIKSAPAGTYKIVVNGTSVPQSPQTFFVVANAPMGSGNAACTNIYAPNNTPATAFGFLTPAQSINPKLCSVSDVEYFKFHVDRSGAVTVSVTSADTPIRATLSGGSLSSPLVASVGAGQTSSLQTTVGTGTNQPVSPAAEFLLKVEATGALGSQASFTITPAFNTSIPLHRRAARH